MSFIQEIKTEQDIGMTVDQNDDFKKCSQNDVLLEYTQLLTIT